MLELCGCDYRLFLLIYTFTLCLPSWWFFSVQLFLSGISQIRNIWKKQGISFQFCLGFEESLMVAQSSTVTMLLGSPISQKLKERDMGDLQEVK